MSTYSTANHQVLKSIAWQPEKPAERINDAILMSRGTSNSYAICSDDGDVIINTGTSYQGAQTRERFETLLGRKLNVKHIIFTQSHPDHIGGWAAFANEQTQTHVQKEFARICNERDMLSEYFMPRSLRALSSMLPKKEHVAAWYADTREPEPLTTFADSSQFNCANRRYELFSVPSGETLDALITWLPEEKTVFTGNFLGAIQAALPNFYTARGDRQRSVGRWFEDIELLISLNPETLITGHDEPICGQQTIKAYLTKIRDAIRYIHDETVAGMSAHKSLWVLMSEITLPNELTPAAGRCPVSWIVRAIWEEYTGWFRSELTSELYATAPSSIWPELAQLAGGVSALLTAAKNHIKAGTIHQAMHFVEIAIAAEPANPEVRKMEVAVLEKLIDINGGDHFDELGWLEYSIAQAKQVCG
jgi:alkyl sulfatase BDS1-like metallo-beta-lactamase superfamily hydrolase